MKTLLTCVLLVLAGCGGGGSGESGGGNSAPRAQASVEQTVTVGGVASLSASGSSDVDGDALSYSWALTSKPSGSVVGLTEGNTVATSLVPDVAGLYTLTLAVSDGSLVDAVSVSFTAEQTAQSQNQRALAQAALLSTTVAPGDGTQRLEWVDNFPAGTSYRVEARGSDGSFSTLDTVAGTGTGQGVRWQRTALASTTYRVQAQSNGLSTALLTSDGNWAVQARVPAVAPSIALDKPEPLSDSVQLSVDTGLSNSAVAWFVDLSDIGNGAAGPGAPITWNTVGSANGSHQLLARAQTAPSTYLELRRAVTVSNSVVRLTASTNGSTVPLYVDSYANSPYPIVLVEARLNSVLLGSLTAPNLCPLPCRLGYTAYRFTLDAIALGSGTHNVVLTATDSAGNQQSLVVPVLVSNPPPLSITAPTPGNGATVFGTLSVAGSFTSDKPAPNSITVTATLAGFEFMRTTSASGAGSFGGSLDLTGISPGSYLLSVHAVDSAGAASDVYRYLIVASSVTLAYPPLFELPADGTLLAADGARAVYRLANGSMRLRDAAAGTDVVLLGAASEYPNIQLGSSKVYAVLQDTDCPATLYCIYEWQPDGTRLNLSSGNPHGAGRTLSAFVVRGEHVVWVNRGGSPWAPGSFTVFDAVARTYREVTRPASAVDIDGSFDFVAGGGVVDLVFSGPRGGGASDVYHWSSLSATTENVSAGSGANTDPKTDGQRIAWRQSDISGTTTSLASRALGGGATSTLATTSVGFALSDGVVGWEARTSVSTTIKGVTATATATLSTLLSATLVGSTGGNVVYAADNKIYSWKGSTGQTTLRVDVMPTKMLLAQGELSFVYGSTVYRVPLD